MRSSSVLAKKQQPVKKHSCVRYGVCGNCSAGCGIKAFMDGSAPVDFFGDEEHPANKGSLCPKGLSLYHTHDHPKRLLTPCLRERPGDAWKPVGWDEALDAIAQRLSALGEGAALALPASPHDPLDYHIGAEWCASVRPGTVGPAALTPRPLGSRGALAAMYGIPGTMLLMNAQRDWAISRAILVVGGDMAAESPVTFGPLEDARDRGNALLYLGSCNGMTALRATEAMLVRPGTEAAALAAIIHVLLREKWIHEAFLAEYADGVEELRRKVSERTPAHAARICGVEENQIERFARTLGCKAPVQVQTAGYAALPFADDAALSLCGALVALRGCIGVPGGGLNLGCVSPFRTDVNIFDGKPAEPQRLDELLAGGGCRAVMGFGNWAASIPGGDKTRAALKACKLVVHVGCFDDETRALAHISLPAAHWSEYASLVDGSATRALQWRDALHEPAGQSRTPLDIWSAVASRLAPSQAPWEAFPGETAQHRLAGFVLASHPLTKGIGVDALDRKACGIPGGIQWPCVKPEDAVFENSRFIRGTVRGQNILLAADSTWPGMPSRFPTDNGRIRLAATVVPDAEAVAPAPGKLALVLSEQVLHAANHPATVRRNGLPLAGIHPETALKLNLGSGDTVRISGADASVKAAVRLTWSAAPETIVLEPSCGIALLPVGQTVPTTAVHVEKATK